MQVTKHVVSTFVLFATLVMIHTEEKETCCEIENVSYQDIVAV